MTKTIPQLNPVTPPLTGTELFELSQAGVSFNAPLTALLPNIAGAKTAPAAQTSASAISMGAGVTWDYFNSPYAGISFSPVANAIEMGNNTAVIGGAWTNSGSVVQINGNGASVLFAELNAPSGGSFATNGVIFNAPTLNTMVIGTTQTVDFGYGVLANLSSGTGLDSVILALNNITVTVGGDAIELNFPGVLGSNIPVLGNILTTAEFAVGIAAGHNIPVVGNAVRLVTGVSGSYGGFHIEDSQHSIAVVGNTGHQISGYGISIQGDPNGSDYTSEGIVACGNNLKAATASFTGQVSGTTLIVTVMPNYLNYNNYIGTYTYLQGAGITASTYRIIAQLTSAETGGVLGGKGTYQLSSSPGTIASQAMQSINDNYGFYSVYNGNIPGPSAVVGNRFQGFSSGITNGSSDIIAFGNMLSGQIGSVGAAIYNQTETNVWGTNLCSNYPILCDGANQPNYFVGKIISTTPFTAMLGTSCGAALMGFGCGGFDPTLVNGVNSIIIGPAPGFGHGYMTVRLASFSGGTAYLTYGASLTFNAGVLTVEADTITSALTGHSAVSYSISGGNLVLNTTYAGAGGQAFGNMNFDGWISNY